MAGRDGGAREFKNGWNWIFRSKSWWKQVLDARWMPSHRVPLFFLLFFSFFEIFDTGTLLLFFFLFFFFCNFRVHRNLTWYRVFCLLWNQGLQFLALPMVYGFSSVSRAQKTSYYTAIEGCPQSWAKASQSRCFIFFSKKKKDKERKSLLFNSSLLRNLKPRSTSTEIANLGRPLLYEQWIFCLLFYFTFFFKLFFFNYLLLLKQYTEKIYYLS